MATTRFKITYADPETGEPAEHVGDYEPTFNGKIESAGRVIGRFSMTAREWAEDHAYALADKGPYTITEVRNDH